MDIGLNEQQEMLKRTAREFLEANCPKKLVRECEDGELGYSPQLWRQMADLGWLGLPLPEAYGGLGMGLVDLAVLCEEMGRAAAPGLFHSTVVQGALAILEAGTEAQKQRFLPSVAAGDLLLALALTEPTASYRPEDLHLSARREGDGFVVEGTKLFVADARVADYLVVVARTSPGGSDGGGLTLFLVDGRSEGIERVPLDTIAGDKQCEVTFHGVRVGAEDVLGPVDQAWQPLSRVMDVATTMKCAEMVGGMRFALEMSLDYAKQRVAFGRPIGSFQAIQHKFAQMVTEVDSAYLALYEAAWRLDEGLSAEVSVSLAKATASEAYWHVCYEGHEIHAGVAFFFEHDLQLYTRRAKAAEHLWGSAAYHRQRMARYLGEEIAATAR